MEALLKTCVVRMLLMTVALFAAMAAGCAQPTPEEPTPVPTSIQEISGCTYKTFAGSAEIQSMDAFGPQADQFDVKFLFTPDNLSDQADALRIQGVALSSIIYNRGGIEVYPRASDLEAQDINIGVTFRTTLSMILDGTCAPHFYDLSAVGG